jgi:predicted ATPase/DNA-binding XRE family transcriptional regulator
MWWEDFWKGVVVAVVDAPWQQVDPRGGGTVVTAEAFRDYMVMQRRVVGWTQEELAEHANLSVRTIRNIETGSIVNPRPSSMKLVLEALDAEKDMRFARAVTHRVSPGLGPAGRTAVMELRTPTDALVGRDDDLRRLHAAMLRHRVVVITGPVGVGKSALAHRIRQYAGHYFADGVRVVEINAVGVTGRTDAENAEQLHRAVRETCRDLPSRTFVPTSSDGIGGGTQMLLILENAEACPAAVARLTRMLLGQCPYLQVMITSQHVLPMPGAFNWEVTPLAVDEPGRTNGGTGPAVELFLALAATSCPSLDLTGRRAAVAELCRRLDGLPLALEVAAGQLRSVSLDTLLDGVVSPRRAEPADDGDPRRSAMVRRIARSWEMLGAAEQRLLRPLATVDGPFTVDDVVRKVEPGLEPGLDVVGALAGLVDRSMVQVKRSHEYEYRVLEVVRDYIGRHAADRIVGAGSEAGEMGHAA